MSKNGTECYARFRGKIIHGFSSHSVAMAYIREGGLPSGAEIVTEDGRVLSRVETVPGHQSACFAGERK